MNKNGFISTAMSYTFLIVFAFLLLTIIKSYNINVTLNEEIKNKAKDDLINEYTYFAPGSCTQYNVTSTGSYRIELWGADGGSANNSMVQGGHGAYTAGTIALNSGDILFFCVGKKGLGSSCTDSNCGYNGGGTGNGTSSGGGGATDVRISSNVVSNRIMIAAGGGGASYLDAESLGIGGNAGGIEGSTGFQGATTSNSSCTSVLGGTQTTGANSTQINGAGGGAGGGGGYYAGFGSTVATCGGGGGSSYISGHLGSYYATNPDNCALSSSSNDINCSKHSSGKYFVDTKMYYVDVQTNKKSVPVPVYSRNFSFTYGDGSARIYKVG